MEKHNLGEYSDKILLEMCKSYQYRKDIPRWLYTAIRKRGIQDIATEHMINLNPKRTYEEVEAEAKKYEFRIDFQRNANWAYLWAKKHNVLDKVCVHLKRKINAKKRCLYLVTFDDNTAYVGITWNIKDRWRRHMDPNSKKISPVYMYHKKTGLEPHIQQLTDYISVVAATNAEKKYIRENPHHYKLLNSSTGGELGSIYCKWSKKKIWEIVEQCNSYKEFLYHKNAYSFARRNNMLREIQQKLPCEREMWTEERLREVLGACTSYMEAREKYAGAINSAKVLGIFEEIAQGWERKIAKPYTPEIIKDAVKGLKHREDFARLSRSMVEAAKRFGIYGEIIQNLPIEPQGKSLNDYIEMARSYKYRGEFKKAYPGAYAVIIQKGWADKCFAHMEYLYRVNLSDEEILQGALKYETINEWQINEGGAYNAAKKRGLFEKATKHMHRPKPHNTIPDSYYISLSSQYTDLKQFRLEYVNEYAAIVRRGKVFYEMCTKHMKKRKHTYTKEEAFSIAKQYKSRMELNKANLSVYTFLYTRGLLDECFPK